MALIAVADFGTGNLRSVHKAIERVAPRETRVVVSDEPAVLDRADRVVWPGQGSIATCIDALDRLGLREVLDRVLRSRPLLGICLGLQAMYESSEEGGGVQGLAALRGTVRHFNPADRNGALRDPVSGDRLKIPHMGWNNVSQTRRHPLWRGIPQDQRFYFVHSYRAQADDPAQEFGTAEYGARFTAAGGRDNFFGVQFHPEKSQSAGLRLIENFVNWDGVA